MKFYLFAVGSAVDVTPRHVVEPTLHPLRIELSLTLRTVRCELKSLFLSQRRRMMTFGHKGAPPK